MFCQRLRNRYLASNMRRFLATLVLLSCGYSPAFGASFSFDGFYLGMPRPEATKVRPVTQWQLVMQDTPSQAERKEFTSTHLGHEARVSIDLDRAGQFVRTIGFAFLSQSDSQCILDAVGARLQLERMYGAAAEASSEPPARRAMWSAGDGLIIRWMEACAVGAQQYFVTYSKPAG
jgi:hypothetical protein